MGKVCYKTVCIESRGRKFKDIAAGMGHILALTEDGEVFGQGANVKSQLGKAVREGDGKKRGRKYLTYYKAILELSRVPCRHKIVQVNAGQYHSMLLSGSIPRNGLDKGEAYVLGSTRFKDLTSELLSREITDCVVPKQINLPVKDKIVEIATGNNHTLFLTGALPTNRNRKQ